MADLLEAQFKIIECRDCPLYEKGDEFNISGLSMRPPDGKSTCLFLARDITGIIVEKMDSFSGHAKRKPIDKGDFNCSGCSGLVKFAHVQESKFFTPQMRMMVAAEERQQQNRSMGSFFNMMNSFSFFKALEGDSLQDIFSRLVMKNFKAGEVILQAGRPGRYLYFILAGRVAVMDSDNQKIALLGRGEIFGEMSLLSGKSVCATITSVEPVKILVLSGKDLSQILIKYPSLQGYFTRLLAQRLADTNVGQLDKTSQAFSGQLGELPPAELFQMLNENAKTGVVELTLGGGKALVVFSEGEVVRVDYKGLHGAPAFNAILKEQDGRFIFSASLDLEDVGASPIASFMKLLMDGLRNIDEGNSG